jgi:hypothetical protein
MALDRVQEVNKILSRESLATALADQYLLYKTARREWDAEKRELRNFIFATDTTTTTNSQLPWKNKTVRPKICQIRDNLHANYMAALFPNDDWLEWEGNDEEEATQAKSDIITNFMQTKINQTDFKKVISELVYDYIDYGNCFGDVVFERSVKEEEDGSSTVIYAGPRAIRLSPFDIAFDLTANNFNNAPKFTRDVVTLGDIKRQASKYPSLKYREEVINKLFDVRRELGTLDSSDIDKADGYMNDGFGTMSQYYRSGYVELLTFEGDIFDSDTGEYHEQVRAVVVDRSYLLSIEPIPTYSGRSTKQHCSWRQRPDNIYGMGPLDNLVGMQYRIDHLENLKADVFDLIAFPPLKIKGYVEDFDWAPMEQIVMDNDADVEMLRPDATALNADMQIKQLEEEMEEMAGAPKQAMGIRTPGEKTAYEVQSLQNAAGRIFQSKVAYFEENFLEPLLNSMLEVARKNMDATDTIRIIDELGAVEFAKVTKEHIVGSGKIRPRGARHFAARAQLVQELTQMMQSIGQDPAVSVHISGKKLAKLLEDKLGLKRYDLVQDNIRVIEQMETQQAMEAGQDELTKDNAQGGFTDVSAGAETSTGTPQTAPQGA